jgi:hypothetical protein
MKGHCPIFNEAGCARIVEKHSVRSNTCNPPDTNSQIRAKRESVKFRVDRVLAGSLAREF